jgi:hypothetical protein
VTSQPAPVSRARRSVRRSLTIAGLGALLLPLAVTAAEAQPAGRTAAVTAVDAGTTSARNAASDLATAESQLRRRHWPTGKNTGARGDLRTVRGRTITRDGVTLKNLRVRGQITIHSDDVTLRNVHVVTDDTYGVLVYGRQARILHTTIEGHGRTLAGLAGYPGGQFIARRVNVFGTNDGVRMTSRSRLVGSFVHGLKGDSDSHYDTVTADGYKRWVIRHNRLYNPHGQTGVVWIGDIRYDASSGLLKNNYIAGGGYSIYAGHSVKPGLRVVDNVFSTRFFRDCGYWGLITEWHWKNNTWSNNRWIDGGRKGSRIRP